VALIIHSWTNDGKIRAIGRLPKNGRKCRSGVGAPGGDVVGVQLADYRRCRLWITCSDHHINPPSPLPRWEGFRGPGSLGSGPDCHRRALSIRRRW
jgi:hypothetical protein